MCGISSKVMDNTVKISHRGNTVNSHTNCLAVMLKSHTRNLSQHYLVIFYWSSTTVAIQCLETTFKISSSDCHLAVPQPLREIFLNSLLKVGTEQSMGEKLWQMKEYKYIIIQYCSYKLIMGWKWNSSKFVDSLEFFLFLRNYVLKCKQIFMQF